MELHEQLREVLDRYSARLDQLSEQAKYIDPIDDWAEDSLNDIIARSVLALQSANYEIIRLIQEKK